MTPQRYQQVYAVFQSACALAGRERTSYLSNACKDDPELRREVESLLACESDSQSFLESPLAADAIHQLQASLKTAGSHPQQIDRYRILGILGEGGMGVVYEAQQHRPERSVALKVIRPGIVSAALLRRFELESQVLGRLHHPGIAQIFDAGTADTGAGPQPYFAMELVKGRTLIEHAEACRMGRRERLALLIDICEAIEHAHQRGVIHRDLKPANILVDESGRPKILDFGVARATDGDLQATTAQTGMGQLVGTLNYMSPEQLSGQPGEVDTRSDIYALGVIGYEMLSGRLPHQTSGRTLPETVRIISQEDHTPLSTVDARLRGDVETIIDKALDKDKARRYQTASALADDIRRYLADEPIVARPPSTLYMLRKFAKRNRGLVAGLAVAFIVLLAGLVAVYVKASEAAAQANRATAAATKADAEAAKATAEAAKSDAALEFVERMFTIDPDTDGRQVTVYDMLGKASQRARLELASQPKVEATVRATIARSYKSLGQYADARREYERTLELACQAFGAAHISTLLLQGALANTMMQMGERAEAESILRDVQPAIEAELGLAHDDSLSVLMNLGLCLAWQGRYEEAEPLLARAVAECQRNRGASHRKTLEALNNHLSIAWGQSKLNEAEVVLRQIVAIEQADGVRSSMAFIHLDNLGSVLNLQGKRAEAEQMHRRALEGLREIKGPEHPDALIAMRNLADVLSKQRRLDQAVALATDALEMERRTQGDNPRLVHALADLASYLGMMGQVEEAERLHQEAIELSERFHGPEHLDTLNSRSKLALLLLQTGRNEAGEKECRALLALAKRSLGSDHLLTLLVMDLLGQAQTRLERLDEAQVVLAEAIEIAKRFLPPGHWRTAMYRLHHGTVLRKKGEFATAEAELQAGYTGIHSVFGPNDRKTLSATGELVALYEAWDKPELAAQWRAKSAAGDPAGTSAGP